MMFCGCWCDCLNYLDLEENVICNDCYFGDHTWEDWSDDSVHDDEDW